jgi:Ino eighty subunit 2
MARQAVLASVVGFSHLSLGAFTFLILPPRPIIPSMDEPSRKKKQLNEAEIALRREETARNGKTSPRRS